MSTIKTTGAEFKAFIAEPWPDDKFMDDECIYVDGEEYEGPSERIKDTASLRVEGGYVQDPDGTTRTLAAEFRAWRKRRDSVAMVVTCAKADANAVRAAVRAAGGTVA